MEKNPEERDPEADNREQPPDATPHTGEPVDGPGGDEDSAGATSQDQPEPES